MKKKLVLIMAVVLVLSTLLAGCNLFTVNAERDNNQVLATVKHNGLVSEISKGEFSEYFAQNFQTYNYYYGWTAEVAGDNFMSMLARQKMIVTLAVEKFSNNKANANKFNSINQANIKSEFGATEYGVYAAYLLSLLNPDEQLYVKNQTNKMFEDRFNDLIDEKTEADKIKEETEKDDNAVEKAPRPTKPEEENDEFEADEKVTMEQVNAVKDFFATHKPNDKSSKYEKEAYNEVKRDIEKQFKSYNYYLAKQAESRLVAKYSDAFGYNGAVDAQSKYNITLDNQKQIYKLASKYKTDIEANSDVIVYHNGQYIKVKSILLKFSEAQTAALNYFKAKYSSEEQKGYVNQLREMLVFGNVNDIDVPDEIKEELLGLRVYKSNPDYDSKKPQNYEKNENLPYIKNPDFDTTKPESETNEKWLSVPFLDVIGELGAAIAQAGVDAAAEYDEKYAGTGEAYEVGKKMFINQKKLEKFEDWIYLVNDDDGMFQGKDYLETPFGNKSDYVAEYTGLVRQLMFDNGTAGSVMVNTDNGTAFVDGVVKTTAKVGDDNIDIYTDTNNNISFIINEFGVHIVMLTNLPVDKGYNEGKYTAVENPEFDGYFDVADEDRVKAENSFITLHQDAYVAFDEKTGKALTVLEQLEKDLKDSYDSYTYSEHEKKLFEMYGEKLFDTKDDKAAAEGYKDFKFELDYNKSIFNKVVNNMKKYEVEK